MLNIWHKTALIALAFTAAFVINRKFNLPDDNHIEEGIEDFIEMQTEINIDLTPLSSEMEKPDELDS